MPEFSEAPPLPEPDIPDPVWIRFGSGLDPVWIRFGSGLDPVSDLFAEWIRYQDPGSVPTGRIQTLEPI